LGGTAAGTTTQAVYNRFITPPPLNHDPVNWRVPEDNYWAGSDNNGWISGTGGAPTHNGRTTNIQGTYFSATEFGNAHGISFLQIARPSTVVTNSEGSNSNDLPPGMGRQIRCVRDVQWWEGEE
jgi:hypothetical protein